MPVLYASPGGSLRFLVISTIPRYKAGNLRPFDTGSNCHISPTSITCIPPNGLSGLRHWRNLASALLNVTSVTIETSSTTRTSIPSSFARISLLIYGATKSYVISQKSFDLPRCKSEFIITEFLINFFKILFFKK